MAWTRIVIAFVAGIALAACANQPSSHVCASGIICPDPLQCAAVQQVCISNLCGNGIVDPGETCDDGNILDGDGCASDCKSMERCGDGVLNVAAGEVCDDGNTVSGDGCSADCKSNETCGNGILDQAAGEICDDGNTKDGKCADGTGCNTNADCTTGMCSPDGCSANCKSKEVCGNGIKDLGEVCDDGNTVSGDSCESDCQSGMGCRNGVIDPGEECDDGNQDDNDDCRNNCHIAVCGDGVQNTDGNHKEDCDPSVGFGETQGCNADCTTPKCGDGKVNHAFTPPGGTAPEQCDLGSTGLVNNNADDVDCTAHCLVNYCGDGLPNTMGTHHETCDDGNEIDNDACTNACQLPKCGDGILDPNEQCDLGSDTNGVSLNTLTSSCPGCQLAFCGDGLQDNGELCDPTAAHVGTDHNGVALCNHDCTIASCGDGKVNASFMPDGTHPEQCDLGGANSDTGSCTTSCQIAVCGDTLVEGLEDCDTGPTHADSATCVGTTCRTSFCGDNHLNTTIVSGHQVEDCDHGTNNGTPGDSCNSQCHVVGCGNGFLDPGEQCDPTAVGWTTSTCNSDCTTSVCGDHKRNLVTETCDDGNLNGLACPYNTSCTNCNSTCTGTVSGAAFFPRCGDSTIQTGDGEECDTGSLNNKMCSDLGFTIGTLSCIASGSPGACTFDTSHCIKCGDGIVEGASVGGTETCEPPNTNACDASCHIRGKACGDGELEPGEECDGSVSGDPFNGLTCASFGFNGVGGSLTCTSCVISETNCLTACDVDNVIEAGEQCDPGTGAGHPAQLNGATCSSLGYTGGSLGCKATCAYDVGACTKCGNGVVEAGETCDQGALNGTLACPYGDRSCAICNSTCTGTNPGTSEAYCGDGVPNGTVAAPEACDLGAANGLTQCAYKSGTTATSNTCSLCNSTCTVGSASGTGPYCGDHILDGDDGEACDDGHLDETTTCAYGTPTCTKCHACQTTGYSGPFCGDGLCNNGETNGSCAADCTCGDGILQGTEVCDDPLNDGSGAFGVNTCASEDPGFPNGHLTCNATCSAITTGACTM